MRKLAAELAFLLLAAPFLAACDGATESEQTVPLVGLITNNPNGLINVEGFRDGMAALGFVEGESITYLSRGSPVPSSELDRAISEMIAADAALIFTAGTPTGVAAHRMVAGTEVPVVFGVIADPIAAGVMTDLTHPGGNITGVKLSQSQDRRLQLFTLVAPGMRRLLIPYNPTDAAPSSAVAEVKSVALQLGLELVEAPLSTDEDVTKLLESFPKMLDGVFLVPDSTVNPRLGDLLAVAKQRRLPVSGPSIAQVKQGALMTYGFVHYDAGFQAAAMADQVLRGVDAGDLPVQTAEFFFAINLKAANEIGLMISDEIIQQADLIIRQDEHHKLAHQIK